jgi:hypothetical protein
MSHAMQRSSHRLEMIHRAGGQQRRFPLIDLHPLASTRESAGPIKAGIFRLAERLGQNRVSLVDASAGGELLQLFHDLRGANPTRQGIQEFVLTLVQRHCAANVVEVSSHDIED